MGPAHYGPDRTTRVPLRRSTKGPSMSRGEWKERSLAWQVEPDSLDSLCDFVTEGGTLSEYCSSRQIKYRMTLEWLQEDEARHSVYLRAVESRGGVLQDGVLGTLRNAATIDPADLYDQSGELLHPQLMSENVRHSLTEVTETMNARTGEVTTKVKFTPRHSAAMDLGKHLGMFKDKVEVTGKDGAPLEEIGTEAARRIAFALESAARKQPVEQGS